MAADTYTPQIGAILQGTGNNNNSWGVNLNNALTNIDKAIAGIYAATVTGGTLDLDDITPPAGVHPLVEMIVHLDGTLASNQIVLVPNVSKLWLVNNECAGAFTVKFKTAAGSASATIPVGWSFVWCDGDDAFKVGLSTSLRDTQWLGADGTLSLPGISFASEATMGIRRVSSEVMAIVIDGVDVMTISATGVNIASGLAVTIDGISVMPVGAEIPYAGIFAPSGWYFEYGQAVSRTTDAGLFATLTTTVTATRSDASTGLTSVSVDLTGLGLEGAPIEGTGINASATIVSLTSTTITMSHAAVGSGSITLRILPHGRGDGSTTFNLPDGRGRVVAGRDNMGATSANRLTALTGGIDGDKLAATGGAESHTLTAAQLPSHAHSVYLHDPGHTHTIPGTWVPQGAGGQGGGGAGVGVGTTINVQSNVTGVTVRDAAGGAGTANQTAAYGDNAAHNNVQPTRISNYIIKR